MTKKRNPRGSAIEKLEMLGVDALCEEIVEGKSYGVICRELDIAKKSLIDWVAADDDRARLVREARIAAAESFVEMADEELAKAKTPFQLAKAKERSYHWRWRASKADPRFGDKTEISGPGGGPIQSESKATLDVAGLSNEQLRALASIAVHTG